MIDSNIEYPYEEAGTIVRWCVSQGEKIDQGKPLVIIQLSLNHQLDLESSNDTTTDVSTGTTTTTTTTSTTTSTTPQQIKKKPKREKKDTGERVVLARHDGTMRTISMPAGSIIDTTKVKPNLGRIEYCTHDMQFHGMCATCGRDVAEQRKQQALENQVSGRKRSPNQDSSQPIHSILHGQPHITVSHKMAQQIEEKNAKRLLDNKKLSLVLDLDHTIIHAIMEQHFMEVPYWRTIDRKKSNIHEIILNGNQRYFIKLRPHLYEFLREVNRLFELHIYTMGTRNYAQKIASLVDPKQRVFKERVLSRDDTPNDMNHKTLKRLFPCDDSMVLIVDDRSDVWKKSKNLIQIVPYLYFVGCKDMVNLLPTDKQSPHQQLMNDEPAAATAAAVNTPTPPSPGSPNVSSPKQKVDQQEEDDENSIYNENDESEGDHHLRVILSKLTEIHTEFYKQVSNNQKPHVTNIVDDIKKKILKDVYIVLSGIYPINSSQPQPLRILAEEMGATVQNEITPKTTHVMAARVRRKRKRKGTSKVNQAISMGLHVVNSSWLESTAMHWTKLDENDFPIKDSDSPPPRDNGNGSKHKSSSSSSSTLSSSSAPAAAASSSSSINEDNTSKFEEIVRTHDMVAAFDQADKELEEFLADGDESDGSSSGASSNGGDSDSENQENDYNDNGKKDEEQGEEEEEDQEENSHKRKRIKHEQEKDIKDGEEEEDIKEEEEENNNDIMLDNDLDLLLEEELEKSFKEIEQEDEDEDEDEDN
ncbi:putative tfiif-interacting component of the c-terminal domain phosphatase [Cavenderia fasciculata]|uniref:RNA polymerase II subunit A C-terminal domain phosphatase n=1 Tax=Cavenderia fasciculata TaxID=261658 RepID=F4PU54_CACFS|nr:putative tfiif-interacting component of the c-terminal domain phosphatase [Cavenderia fasciculata]EGG20980.1 putative tfiif-interacting component of the c-terminal domain phosphatase [Cavenderia fasciculata]|eukprot:XP_004358830.1 putative tfiif-interacting component of the c-terminal domain phosphatase [Cavenderia fasciculata]